MLCRVAPFWPPGTKPAFPSPKKWSASFFEHPVAARIGHMLPRVKKWRSTMKEQLNHDPRYKFPRPGKQEKPQDGPGIEEGMNVIPEYGEELYKGSGRLRDKAALITGGDSGIGRAIAVAYAKEGANVAISYLPEEEEDAKVTVQVIEAAGQKAVALPGDLNDAAYCGNLINSAVAALGKIDVLVNNAAEQKYFKGLAAISGDDFAEIYRVNVIVPFLLSKAAAAKMQPGASIINTVSVQAYEPSALLLPYAASKAALVALTKGMAEELIKQGIRVNAVAPGPIWSPLNTHGSPPEKLKKFGESTAIGRPGQPVELAPVYVLLASDEASYITGEIYGITGGQGIA
jgi:NAD(P)-dependent dehydrogenase (short-subunit alcohol dehydrogenase family)